MSSCQYRYLHYLERIIFIPGILYTTKKFSEPLDVIDTSNTLPDNQSLASYSMIIPQTVWYWSQFGIQQAVFILNLVCGAQQKIILLIADLPLGIACR